MRFIQIVILPLFLVCGISSCQQNTCSSETMFSDVILPDTSISDISNPKDFRTYFDSMDTSNTALHFDFLSMEDYGPIRLSEQEIKQIYCEIKRGSIKAYKILLLHYFYTYETYISQDELYKLIYITDYLAVKSCYYEGYGRCGGLIFDYLKFNSDDKYLVSVMLEYYEKYFEYSQSKHIGHELYEIYSGKYSFCKKDSNKLQYYKDKGFPNK